MPRAKKEAVAVDTKSEVKPEVKAEVKTEVKAAAKKETKTAAKKAATAKKASAAKKTTAKKAPAKKAAKKAVVAKKIVIQSQSGAEITSDAIVKKVNKAIKGAGKNLEIYVKAEEGKAYYVTADENGAVDLF